MKTSMIAGLLGLLVYAGSLSAQDVPEHPSPEKEHEWLQQFVGEWESEFEVTIEPGQPPLKGKGEETVRTLGGFWIVADGKSEMMGMPFSSVLTLGYDPERQKYVGTWVDSMSSYLWKYEGKVDEAGQVLTVETTGPCHLAAGALRKFKEVTEFKNKDYRVFTSSVQDEDGKWTTIVTGHFRRKK